MEQGTAVRDDCGVVAGHRGGGGDGGVLPALGRVVTPGGSGRNRSVSEENKTWGGRRRSNLGDRKAGPRFFSEYRLGAGPRRRMRSRWAGQWWSVARARPQVARARVGEVPAQGQSSVVADDCDSVGLARDGVACRRWWLCSVDWHANVASGVRRVGRPGCSTVPEAVRAGTSNHIL
jgi:hypothetical protein